MKKLLLAVVIASSFGLALAHSGGTDSRGCHHDTRTGTYHCHWPAPPAHASLRAMKSRP